MAEYAVILGVITPAIILALAALSGSVGTLLDKVRALFGG
jgi:Flp pilus assembly pilin Flp